MRQHVVAEAVRGERVEGTVGAVEGPVAAQLLGTQDQHALVLQLEILDDGQRGVRLAEPDAVGQHAAAVGAELVDRGFRPVALEAEQRLPDAGIGQRQLGQVGLGVLFAAEKIAEHVEQRQVIDEVRRLVGGESGQFAQHLGFHVLRQRVVRPPVVEPGEQVRSVAVAIHDQIEFDVVAGLAQPQARHGEIGAAEQGVSGGAVADVVHLAVQKAGALHRPDFDRAFDPVGAVPGEPALDELGAELEPVLGQGERLGRLAVAVQTAEELRFAEQKAQARDAVQLVLERVVGVDGEESGDDGHVGSGFQ